MDSNGTANASAFQAIYEADLVPLYIAGELVPSTELEKIPVKSTAQNDKIVHFASAATVKHAIQACESSHTGFQSWRKTNAVQRRDILNKAADLILERREELVSTMIAETSSARMWADINVSMTASHIKEIASRITALSGVIPQTKLDYALCFREPVGPCLAIPPWNAPFILGARAVVTPLAAGCSVVMKASELSPKCHALLVQTLIDAGVEKEAINVIQADRANAAAVTEALIAHKAIRHVEFIGSATIGRIIASLAGKYLKPVFCELGGKCAVIVLEDANLDDAAMKCVMGAYNHHGQICFSTDRVYVVKEVADKFIPLLKAWTQKIPVNGAVTQNLAKQARAKLVDAEKKGAKFLVGGSDYKDESTATLAPSIITNTTPDMDIFDEEAFGPSFSFFVVEDQEEALKLVNDSDYGLVGAVHTADMHRGVQLARRMEVGIAHVNGSTAYDESTLPLGGAKNSGWGRTNGSWGLENFTVLQTVAIHMKPGLAPW